MRHRLDSVNQASAVHRQLGSEHQASAVRHRLDSVNQASAVRHRLGSEHQASAVHRQLDSVHQASAARHRLDSVNQASAVHRQLGSEHQASAVRHRLDSVNQASAVHRQLGSEHQASAVHRQLGSEHRGAAAWCCSDSIRYDPCFACQPDCSGWISDRMEPDWEPRHARHRKHRHAVAESRPTANSVGKNSAIPPAVVSLERQALGTRSNRSAVGSATDHSVVGSSTRDSRSRCRCPTRWSTSAGPLRATFAGHEAF